MQILIVWSVCFPKKSINPYVTPCSVNANYFLNAFVSQNILCFLGF